MTVQFSMTLVFVIFQVSPGLQTPSQATKILYGESVTDFDILVVSSSTLSEYLCMIKNMIFLMLALHVAPQLNLNWKNNLLAPQKHTFYFY